MKFSIQGLAGCGAGLAAALLAASSTLLTEPAGRAADATPHIQPLTQKGYTQKIPGSDVTFEMVAIPGGTFVMGSPPSEAGRSADEGPQHPVTIGAMWFGKTEVTWDEYDEFWKHQAVPEPSKESTAPKEEGVDAISRPTPPYADETFGHGRHNHPVICITHHAAMEYCRWLSQKTGKIYRLPTEAEWEYACRAGTTTAYSFGDDPKKLGDYAWFADNSEDHTHEVGTKKPNPWGLYDMYGNVAEWCLDSYDKKTYATFPTDRPTIEPAVLRTVGKRFSDVARGGSWTDPADRCRSAARQGSDKTWIKQDPQRPQSIWWLTDAEFVGFRVVRPVEERANLKGARSLVTKESK
jgi:formylglycine-generating enzyme required for sulfatase activity